MKKIYLDHAATTPVDSRVFNSMKPYFSSRFGNASSLHSSGQIAKQALEKAREKVARAIGAKSNEIIFTSGGTESDNLAILGTINANVGKHIITSEIEHPAVLNTIKFLEKNGFDITYIPVDRDGIIKVEELESVIKAETVLISIMHANNEIGTIQPIEEIGNIAQAKGIPFHCDAVQSVGKIEVDVNKLNVDLLSISSHKIEGPKGVGALYRRENRKIEPIQFGGGHERGLRSGTENVCGCVGFAKAIELTTENLERNSEKMRNLRDKLIDEVLKIPDSYLNGHRTKRLPNNANFRFKYIEGESLLLYLDQKNIEASTGSACSAKSLEPSHVLTAIGIKHEDAHGSLRLTLGPKNTESEIEYVLDTLSPIVKKLRDMSPLTKR